ncbi:MAG: glycosyltransferase family 1 protein [Methylococcales bacterium]
MAPVLNTQAEYLQKSANDIDYSIKQQIAIFSEARKVIAQINDGIVNLTNIADELNRGFNLKIALITDAWHPQINGIVTTVQNTCRELKTLGHTVKLITPCDFRTWPCPGYPDVRLAFLCGPRLRPILKAFKPDAVHLVTEGCVGFAARRYCRQKRINYSTSFHSRYPEYLKERVGFPLAVTNGYLRWFHSKSCHVMVSTESLGAELMGKGYRNVVRWSLGVDTDHFRPRQKSFIQDKRPIFLYAGRVAVEKNVEHFLQLDLPGTKYVVGDGPQRSELEKRYPNVHFTGFQQGEVLASFMAAADCFVFPSLTDTFGLVALESLACGVPVAAYPVQGPKDILRDNRVGVLGKDLKQAAIKALELDPQHCRTYALQYTWPSCTRQFVDNLIVT